MACIFRIFSTMDGCMVIVVFMIMHKHSNLEIWVCMHVYSLCIICVLLFVVIWIHIQTCLKFKIMDTNVKSFWRWAIASAMNRWKKNLIPPSFYCPPTNGIVDFTQFLSWCPVSWNLVEIVSLLESIFLFLDLTTW